MFSPQLSDLLAARHITDDLKAVLEKRGHAPELPIKSMPELTSRLWGLHRGELCIVAARTSNGKSDMVINMAYDLADQGKNVMFLSLEMPRASILERMFCLSQNVENTDLISGGYNKSTEIRQKFQLFCNSLQRMKLTISDCIGRDWEFLDKEIFTKMSQIPDVIFLDHLQEIRGGQSQKAVMDEYISKMRESAIRNNFALVVCSQINRSTFSEKKNTSPEDCEPQLHQLKASGYVEEAADQVILLHWPAFYSKDADIDFNKYVVHVAKNRSGRTGYITMKFYPEFCQIRDGNYGQKKSNASVPEEAGEREPAWTE